MDRLEAMTLLVATVEHGSFSAASRRLGVPLPTLSRKVADLEAHLGTRLLVRTTRRLTLTEAGIGYLAASKRILEDVSEAERAAAGEWQAPRGEIVVTAPVVFGRMHILPIVAAFLARHAEIDVRLLLTDRDLDLAEDHVDVAVRIGALPDSTLRAVAIGAVRRVIVATRDVLAQIGSPSHPDDLGSLPSIYYEGLSAAPMWRFNDPETGSPFAVAIRPRLIVNTVEAALDAAAAGIGFAQCLSYQSAAAERAGRLQTVLMAFEPPEIPIHLLHVARGHLPLKTRMFLDFATERLKPQFDLPVLSRPKGRSGGRSSSARSAAEGSRHDG